jgi:MSHA biogenesis protein MshK
MKTLFELSRPAANTHKAVLMLCLMGSLIAYPAQAETLNDPTQPPASLYAVEDSAAQKVAGPVLQSVLLGQHYSAAIINGEKVMLGEKYEQSTLIKLNEREAVLRNADRSTQTLVLNQITLKKVINSTTGPVAKNKIMYAKPTPKPTK